MGQEFEFLPTPNYSRGVLTGPWVYDRPISLPEKQIQYKHSTTNQDHFGPKPYSRIEPEVVWTTKFQNEDSNVLPLIYADESPDNYFDNFSTLYDLSYNHFPKTHKANIKRKWDLVKSCHLPTDEYLPSFGNITDYGLHGKKQGTWLHERQDPRETSRTDNQCQFRAPKKLDYCFKRFIVARISDSDRISEAELRNFRTKRRFAAKHEPVESTQRQAYKEGYLNPITWECSPDVEIRLG